MARIRAANRDLCRAALFLCMMPLPTIVSITGCALASALAAASRSPDSMAVTTLLIYVRTVDRWATLRRRWVSAWRARLRAWGLLAKMFLVDDVGSNRRRNMPSCLRSVKRLSAAAGRSLGVR